MELQQDPPSQEQQVGYVPEVSAEVTDPFHALPPELVQRFAGFLSGNEVACALRLVNKAAAAQFSRPQDRTVRLSQPVPHAEFVWRWGGEDAMRSLTRQQRTDLPCLVARSGCIANLEVLLTRSDALNALAEPVLAAAAAAGQLRVCRYLRQQGCPYSTYGGTLSMAAEGGSQEVCEWLLANGCPHDKNAAGDAARGGHVGLMDRLLNRCRAVSAQRKGGQHYLLAGAAAGCDLPTLQRLHHTYLDSVGVVLTKEHMGYVVASAAGSPTADWSAKVEWLEGRGYPRTVKACAAAAGLPDGLARLQWLRQQGYPLEAALLGPQAGRSGNIDMLRYLLAEGVEADRVVQRAAQGAAVEGHVAFLRALELEHGRQAADFREATSAAAASGRLPVVEALVEMVGAETVLSADVFSSAVRSGSMELLAWLHEHGCPWDQSVFTEAAACGSEEQLEWLEARGCPMGEDGSAYRIALYNVDLGIPRCLRRLGCPWGPRGSVFTHTVASFCAQDDARFRYPEMPTREATTAAQLAMLHWLVEQGCPVDWDGAARTARWQGQLEVLAWLEEQRAQREPRA